MILNLLALILTALALYWFHLADRLLQHRDPANSWHSWLTIHTRLIQPRRRGDHQGIVELLQRMNLTATMTLVCAVLLGLMLWLG